MNEMIKPNELRIGNYLLEGKVIEIGEDYFRVKNDDGACFQTINSTPITLDESWLLRFGYYVSHGTRAWGVEIKSTFIDIVEGIKLVHTDDGWRVAITMEDTVHFEYPESPVISHVHQFQNLIFALTGEELELKA